MKYSAVLENSFSANQQRLEVFRGTQMSETKSRDQRTRALIQLCRNKGLQITTAESCTGGLISACLTDTTGASAVLDRAFVTYSNAAKTDMLSVPAPLVAAQGAVSAEVAQAMALGALQKANAQIAVAVTGIAGPTGGTSEKPVGLVYLATAQITDKGSIDQHSEHTIFSGDRAQIRWATTERAIALLWHCANECL